LISLSLGLPALKGCMEEEGPCMRRMAVALCHPHKEEMKRD
jgi:hypothetical protein